MRRVAAIPPLTYQHAEDAAFLWHRRRLEIDGPILGETDIGRLDQRLDADLDGLHAAGLAAWEIAQARFADFPDGGEAFVLGAMALRWDDDKAVDAAFEAARAAGDEGLLGLSGAIARTPRDTLRGRVRKWLDARDAFLRYLGLCALSHHRVDPGQELEALIADADGAVRRRAVRLAGELGRRDALAALLGMLDSAAPAEALEAAAAVCLLGEAQFARTTLDRLVEDPALAPTAIEIRLLATPAEDGGRRWLQTLLEKPPLRPAATAAIGLFGDTAVMPWLLRRMTEPETAEAAGRALRDLFEIDFSDLGDLFTADPADLGDPFAELSGGPFPVAARVEAWWDEGKGGGSPSGPFRSMRRLRLEALRAAIAAPGGRLENWRRTRPFPAWL